MKVFDLGCAQGHVFEGWFASEEDFVQQRERALLVCPMCGDAQVEKKLSAPRLNLKSGGAESGISASTDGESSPTSAPAPSEADVQAVYMHVVRALMAKTEDVGERFASEARAMHAGDTPERAIRGQATAQEAQALAEEGIEVMRLAVPDFAKQRLQ